MMKNKAQCPNCSYVGEMLNEEGTEIHDEDETLGKIRSAILNALTSMTIVRYGLRDPKDARAACRYLEASIASLSVAVHAMLMDPEIEFDERIFDDEEEKTEKTEV